MMTKSKIIIIIPARLSSARLPKKQLLKIGNTKIIEIIFKKLSTHFNKRDIFVATSNDKSDNELCEFCKKKNINFFRGSLSNVLQRVYKLASIQKAYGFIRVNGDSPLVNLSVIKKGLKKFKTRKYDLVTNVFPRSYPAGMSVEIIKTQTLQKISKRIKKRSHKEHITPYIYENYKDFRIYNIKNRKNYSNIHLAVDTKKDFLKIKKVILRLKNYRFNLKRIIQTYEKN